jgi:hypothetical protein
MTFHEKQQARINEYLQLEIKLRNGRYKENVDCTTPGADGVRVEDGRERGGGELAGDEGLRPFRIVVDSIGNYCKLGVFTQGGRK